VVNPNAANVLIADDQLEIFRVLLAALPGSNTVAASNSEAAAELAAKSPQADLIWRHVMMPNVSS